MAGLVFPDIAGSVLPFIQMDRQAENDRLTRERQSRLDERQLRMDELTLQDRKDQRALQQMQVLQSMDDKQRAKMKEAADWQGYAAHAVLSAPPETRQQVYTTMLGEAKNRGFNLSGLPQQYTPALDGQLEFYRRQAHGIAEMLTKQDADRPQPLGPVGGAPATPAPNQQQFVETMTPHALEIAKATGLDPRLVLAQSILETGYGVRAPGNNYFGIKGPGQMLATTEAGPGGALVPTQDSFRTYASPGASAQDYISFIKGNQGRYAPVMAAQGLDAQIDAMGKSGYATDPNYAAKLRAIAQGLPPIGAQPTPAPQPGFLPTNVPAQSIPGALPQVAQGDAIAGQGDVVAPPRAALQQEHQEVRQWVNQLSPGAAPYRMKDGSLQIDGKGNLRVRLQNGQDAFFPMPKQKDDAPKTLEERDRETILRGDPNSPDYAAAYAHLGAPRITVDPTSGQMVTIQPDMSWARKPTFAGANAPQSTEPPASGAKTVTVTPGHGRPIPGTENETISKNVAAIGSIDKALDVMLNPTEGAKPSGRTAGFLSRNLGQTGDLIAQEIDPEGVKARALLADINSQIMLARSGAAVTEGEAKRLIALLPSATDNPDVIVQKLQQVRSTYADILKGQASQYTKENGFIPHEGAQKIMGGSAPGPAPKATGAQGPRMSPEEASKLPPGTPFIGMDGVPRVRN